MYRIIAIASILFTITGVASANDYCRSTYCDPNKWAWYPRNPPGQPYGRDVKLSPDGTWMDRDGHRAWVNQGTRRATVISMANSDERNGELAYQTAYDSFMEGKYNGGNKVEHPEGAGRWTTKITTPDGIVLYKDSRQYVAVQSPDGKWHVTNSRGVYASSSEELETVDGPKAMVAKRTTKIKKIAKKKAEPEKTEVAAADKDAKPDTGRKLASVEPAKEEAPAPAGDGTPPMTEAAMAEAMGGAAAGAPSLEKMLEKPAEKTADKVAEAAPEKTADKATEKTADKAAVKVAEKVAEKTPAAPVAAAADKVVEKAAPAAPVADKPTSAKTADLAALESLAKLSEGMAPSAPRAPAAATPAAKEPVKVPTK